VALYIVKVVFSGPPRSGKSCFREGLKQAFKGLPGAPYPFVITACPDGEGAWFQATVNRDQQVAAACKAAYKGAFTPEYVDRVATSVREITLPLVLVDIGGRTSDENRRICAAATHALILSGDPTKVAEWRDFWRELGIPVIAEIASDYHGHSDSIIGLCDDGVWRGSVHHLERGEPAHERPCIRAFAEFLTGIR
jgi:CRISPR-associated protein Csx3